MSNRKNHRRQDRFTGRTCKWHRFKNFPRGMDIIGWDSPASAKQMKHMRVKRLRVTCEYEF